MRTDPIYLTDTYQQSMTAHVLEVRPEPGKRWRVLLDSTVFYPLGGGQPTDQGELRWTTEANGSSPFQARVYQVLTKDGEIWHYLEPFGPDTKALEVDQQVEGVIDWQRRYQNMRVHSAGHLLDFSLFRLGIVPDILRPIKGDHSKKPFVLYQGTLVNSLDLTPARLEEAIDQLEEEERELTWEFVSLEQLQEDAIYIQPGLPTNKPLRKLTLAGIGSVADGGTQVRNTREVGKVTVISIEENEGQVKVAYRLQA